jgi:hypothetical protein
MQMVGSAALPREASGTSRHLQAHESHEVQGLGWEVDGHTSRHSFSWDRRNPSAGVGPPGSPLRTFGPAARATRLLPSHDCAHRATIHRVSGATSWVATANPPTPLTKSLDHTHAFERGTEASPLLWRKRSHRRSGWATLHAHGQTIALQDLAMLHDSRLIHTAPSVTLMCLDRCGQCFMISDEELPAKYLATQVAVHDDDNVGAELLVPHQAQEGRPP